MNQVRVLDLSNVERSLDLLIRSSSRFVSSHPVVPGQVCNELVEITSAIVHANVARDELLRAKDQLCAIPRPQSGTEVAPIIPPGKDSRMLNRLEMLLAGGCWVSRSEDLATKRQLVRILKVVQFAAQDPLEGEGVTLREALEDSCRREGVDL